MSEQVLDVDVDEDDSPEMASRRATILPSGMRFEWGNKHTGSIPEGHVLDVDEDDSPDMMEATTTPEEMRVRCLLLIGGQAEFVVEDGAADDVRRHPAADVAAQAGVPVGELPGKVLVVQVDEDGAGEWRLSGFRLASDA